MKKLYFLMSFLLVALIGSAAEVTKEFVFTEVADLLQSADWSNTVATGAYTGKDANKGVQIGSSKKPAKQFAFSSTGSYTGVKQVIVNASTGSKGECTLSVKVGGQVFLCDGLNEVNPTSNPTDYTFTGSASGEVEISFNATAKAAYVKKFTVIYEDGAAVTEVSAPKFTPIAGTYEGPQNITIESATPDAVITYTINSEPEQTYTAPIALTKVGNYTIKAKATDPTGKLAPSAEVVAEYVINLPVCEAPTFSVKEGTYYEAQNVVISSLTEGASITYSVTKNDAEFVASTTAVAPVTVELPMDAAVASYVITAKAVKDGMTESAEVSAKYTLNPNKPAARMFIMVNDVSELAAGDKVIFVAQQVKDGTYLGDVAMGGPAGKYGMVEHVTVVEGDVVGHGPFKGVIHGENTMNVHVFEIGGDASGYTFQDEADQTYISSTNSNGLYWTSTVSNEKKWTLSNLTEGVTLENVANTGRILKYNPNSPRFATYTSGQEDVLIFKHSVELSGVESNVAEEAAVINTVAGGIVVAVSEPATAAVYTVSGLLVANQVVDATETISLASGFYIVKVGNTVKKVIVR